MSGAVIEVLRAGPLVSVQDGGRRGMMRFGLPGSGAMDRKALAIANLALGNPAGAAGVEVSRGGLLLACRAGAVTLAIAGGGFVVDHAGRRGGSWQVLTLRAGERLEIRPGPWGSWCCIGLAGGLVAEAWGGSAATHALSGLGGGMLAAGQSLIIDGARVMAGREGGIPCPVWARPRARVAVVPGPQDRFFDAETRQRLLTEPFRLTDSYDRMGVRLRGPALLPQGALAIPSAPILRGSVQVSGDGVATVLLADHQTTGGYPKIATLVDDDADGFAQLRPHDRVRFHAVTAEQAVAIARRRRQVFGIWAAALGRRMAARDASG
jgi:allophanate hydrolase